MKSLVGKHPALILFTAVVLVTAGLLATVAPAASTPSLEAAQGRYFPPRGEWESRSPAEMGMNSAALQEAIDFANASQNPGNRDLAVWLQEETGFGREPFFSVRGATTVRTGMNGIIVRGGYIVAEWGDTSKVDMTFSVTKTFLSTTTGLAYDRGMIRSLEDYAVDYMPTDEQFQTDHNRKITWDHLLRQTSDWRGTLFSMPAWADRPARRNSEGGPASWNDIQNVPLSEPGTVYEYNDVRVNLLSLVALNVWRRPLPQVLREYVMDPIGASNTWRWHGYRDSWVDIDGERMQNVSGGGHWGGGMHINAYDMARFGYLFLNDGTWGGQRIVSEEWIELARTPGPTNPTYGFMNWGLNRDVERNGELRRSVPLAPETAVTFSGAGSNLIFIDKEHDLVVVVRWISGGSGEFFGKVISAIEGS